MCPSTLLLLLLCSPFLLSSNDALKHNQEIEFQRNKERFQFLKWGACAFRNMLIVPPGSGIVHQVHSHVMSILGHVMQSCDLHIRSCDAAVMSILGHVMQL